MHKAYTRRTEMIYAVLLVAGFILRLLISMRDVPYLTKTCLTDDSFYIFNIARNIALGCGFRHDSFNITNGFQPLIVFIDSIVYCLLKGEKILSIKVVLILHCLISTLAGILLYRITKLIAGARAALFAVLMWAVTSYVIRQDLNGMETGLVTLLIMCVTYYYLLNIRVRGSPVFKARPFAVMGALCGLAVLARIDALIFVLILLCDVIWVGWRCRIGGKASVRALGPFLFLFGVLIMPWLVINKMYFGSFMPVSGDAVRFISMVSGYIYRGNYLIGRVEQVSWAYYLSVFVYSLKVILRNQPLIYWTASVPWGAVSGAVAVILYLCLCWKRLRQCFSGWYVARMNFLLAFALALISAYSFYILGFWYFSRYYYPIIFLSLIYNALILEVLILRIEELWGIRLARMAVAGIAACIILSQARSDYSLLTSREVGGYYLMSEWVNRYTEEDAVIGVFQSGMFGYFVNRKFIGLDGVINENALDAMKKRKIQHYIYDQGVDYVMDWWEIIDALLFARSGPDDIKLRLKPVASTYFDVYRVERDRQDGEVDR